MACLQPLFPEEVSFPFTLVTELVCVFFFPIYVCLLSVQRLFILNMYVYIHLLICTLDTV